LKVGLKKNIKLCEKTTKKRCKFTIRKKRAKKALNNSIWERLGLHLGGFGGGFGRGLEALGASWVVLEALIFMLVFGMVFKSALGGFWGASWFDFEGFAMDLGRVLGGVWEGF